MRILVYLVGALTCGTAMADTTLVYDADERPFTVRVRPGEIRIDDQGERWQLYRRDEQAIYSVDPGSKTYVRMDADTAATIRGQMQALRQRMESRIAELPPEQRDAARAALAGQVPGLGEQSGEVSVEATGGSDRVAGHECRVVEVRHGGRAAESLCVATREALAMSAEEFATIEGMFGLMQSMLAGTGMEYVGLPYLELSGMPIRYQRDGGGKRTLSRVAHESLSGLVFEIPPGYEARSPQLDQ